MKVAPILVFAWGNPSRGDDALGPLFAERVEALGLPGVECLTDFQLQVEHALDLCGRERVLFADASIRAAAPFECAPVRAARDASFTTHAMSPAALLQAYEDTEGRPAPQSWLLGIRGEQWALGDPPSRSGSDNLEQALVWGRQWLYRGLSGILYPSIN